MIGSKFIKHGIVYLCAGLAVGALVGWLVGNRSFSEDIASLRQAAAQLPALQTEFADQQQQLVNLEMADKVNRMAQEKLRQRVTELQTERVKLESELYVYKKLLEDDETEAGLNMESLMVRPVEGEKNRYTYDIVLRRKAALNQSVEATLTVDVEGKLHGIPSSLSLREVDPELREDTISVSFKYFKVVKGAFVLPEHFVPERLILSLYETGRADSLMIRELPWEPVPHI